MEDSFLAKINLARKYAGTSFKITSGYRCEKHNKAVGGKSESSHLKGYAADISTSTSRKKLAVVIGLIEAGFTRIGVGSKFVHVDNDKNKTQDVMWTY